MHCRGRFEQEEILQPHRHCRHRQHILFARRLCVPFAFDAFHLKWRAFQRDASSPLSPPSPSTRSLNKHKYEYDFFMDNNNFCNLWRLKSELTRAHAAAAATQRASKAERVFVAFAAIQIKKKNKQTQQWTVVFWVWAPSLPLIKCIQCVFVPCAVPYC